MVPNEQLIRSRCPVGKQFRAHLVHRCTTVSTSRGHGSCEQISLSRPRHHSMPRHQACYNITNGTAWVASSYYS